MNQIIVRWDKPDDDGNLVSSVPAADLDADYDPGPVPDDVTVTGDDGMPLYAMKLSELQAEALMLAGNLAADCDDPEKVADRLLKVTARQFTENVEPSYLVGVMMQALRYMTEDLFAPILHLAEEVSPGHDFRGHLRNVGNPNSEAWERG